MTTTDRAAKANAVLLCIAQAGNAESVLSARRSRGPHPRRRCSTPSAAG